MFILNTEDNPKLTLNIAEFHPTIVDLDGDHGYHYFIYLSK